MYELYDNLIICECGLFFKCQSDYKNHLKSDMHRRKLEYLNEIIENDKPHYNRNRERLINYNKQFYRTHKEKILQKSKDKIRDPNRKKIKCGCGSEIYEDRFMNHTKTQKHIEFINNG